MNRYILIHRLTGPAVLLLLGIVALLAEAHVVHFFGVFVPLLLILLGVLKLAERMALAGWEYPAQGAGPQGPGAYPPPYGSSGPAPYASSAPPTSTSIAPTHEFGNGNSDTGEGKP